MNPIIKRLTILTICSLTLAGCDAASELAGEAVRGEIRNAVVTQCEQISQDAGIMAGRVAQVCECSAQTFVEDEQLTLDDVKPERIEAIVNQCTVSTGSQTMSAEQEIG